MNVCVSLWISRDTTAFWLFLNRPFSTLTPAAMLLLLPFSSMKIHKWALPFSRLITAPVMYIRNEGERERYGRCEKGRFVKSDIVCRWNAAVVLVHCAKEVKKFRKLNSSEVQRVCARKYILNKLQDSSYQLYIFTHITLKNHLSVWGSWEKETDNHQSGESSSISSWFILYVERLEVKIFNWIKTIKGEIWVKMWLWMAT
jgi:hypothetical protein